MDYSTVLSLVSFVALIAVGISTGQITSSLVNLHGVLVVFGG